MTLHINPIRRIQATKKLDGHIAIDLIGEIEERREHARVAGQFNTAENIAYAVLRNYQCKVRSTNKFSIHLGRS